MPSISLPKIQTQNYERIVVLTGAGVSQASGIPTFRGPDGALSPEYFRVSDARNLPALLPEMWQTHGAARGRLLGFAPNPAHVTIAAWEKRWRTPARSIVIITQNVDGLHQLAGSHDVIEIHGSLRRSRCMNPDCPSMPFFDTFVPLPGDMRVPSCKVCGDNLRPDITLFHEPLPVAELHRVKTLLRGCDLFLAVGTSGAVAPASEFVRGAKYAGARTILVNLTPLDPPNPYFDEEFLGRAEEILPELLH